MTNPLPPGPFALIYADPPWQTVSWNGAHRTPTSKRQADHYATMSAADLKAMPVASIAAKNAHLAMWVIGSHLDQALDLGCAWGFTYVTDLFVWAKQRQLKPNQVDMFTDDVPPAPLGMGKHTRKQAETCLLFKRGKGLRVLDHSVAQLIVEPRREHSRKPDRVYGDLEKLYGYHPRVELFARSTREGWSSWGNQVGKLGEAAKDQAA
ncbi:MAG: MT-A70 family methyltransferase [Novosphingobium sp.]|uniref:MT-A70 family methyltransferase n=1 Tax=Novosphingobium sp. TaxID=1874826 RepID=UPI0027366E54|nr:MT-A70 family methyltransferase [Novosphingobium sp.]MDP3550646.1 MT-A70 family methyltransferase [Novosphingobium sp.]